VSLKDSPQTGVIPHHKLLMQMRPGFVAQVGLKVQYTSTIDQAIRNRPLEKDVQGILAFRLINDMKLVAGGAEVEKRLFTL
jgi:hypothetical protein